jgi:hypothetical protein
MCWLTCLPDFFQNYIKFTKDPKQTKILILQFAKSIAVGHSSEKPKIDYVYGLKCYQLYHVLPVCRLFPIKNVYSSIFSPTTTWSQKSPEMRFFSKLY